MEIAVADVADHEIGNAAGIGLGDRQAFDFASVEARICQPFSGKSICHSPLRRTHQVDCSFFLKGALNERAAAGYLVRCPTWSHF